MDKTSVTIAILSSLVLVSCKPKQPPPPPPVPVNLFTVTPLGTSALTLLSGDDSKVQS